ncbi:hypothetical protein [Streptomyces sp. AM 2-1-1]|uniref:hypothetical protein n=1 Tax=Streptomyces sp. AM 2-1-1 TaxID=3028709 RepID=UPI0023B91D2A|nr:hypothetical protein [Streptomyces sp. AM 2-1-1]WEH38500.1 hypothetical protein PZB77_02720 [Streptomyces sp. AM 2-1-1]
MSTADQEQGRAETEEGVADENREVNRDEGTEGSRSRVVGDGATEDGGPVRDTAEEESATHESRLTPRQARRLRIALSSVGMAVMAVVLWMRIASRSSVLVVGVYGLALILCGVVMELSRAGRTRLASWLLGIGLLAAVGTDWLLLP